MKNREKYPNTDDAVKAYEEHKKECNCNCTFTDWLDFDEDKFKESKGKFDRLFAALTLVPIGFRLFAGLGRRQAETFAPKPDSEESKSDITGVECPLCHGKRGHFEIGMLVNFHCPDCDALIYKKSDVARAPFDNFSPDEFKSWFDKLPSVAKKD